MAGFESTIQVADLPQRARRALDGGDLNGYRGLFGYVQAIADPHRRYWAAKTLLEQGLKAAGREPALDPAGLHAAVAAGALEALEREPREPKLLEYGAIALCELWCLDAARAMFEAAGRLDSQLRLEGNLAELDRRRVLGRELRRTLAPQGVPKGLQRRAVELAAGAQPAQGLRLSLCMIVRDEEEMLGRCLEAVVDAVDEIVVVDTGSNDRTVEIAESFGARVLVHEWTGSFADARNVSFDAAGGDWIMYLDADEVLVREDAAMLRALTGRTWREAFYLSETNYTGDLEDGTAVTHNALRVYRNRPEYRFEGRLHEQIANRLPGYLPERLEATTVRVEHFGYLGAVRDSREKSRRNIELLRLQQAESAPTPFLHFNLGSEYAAAGDAPAALAEFERSWELLQSLPDRDSYQFAPALTSRLVKALRACGRLQDAIDRARQGLVDFPGFTDLVMEQGIAAAGLGEQERAIELFERCLEMGDAPGGYTATVGCGSYLAMVNLAELRRARGEHGQAVELLERCLREHPGFLGAVLPYATALLADGATPEAVRAGFELNVPEPSPAARFMLGTALYESGATEAGERQFRAVLERQPRSGRARVALGEALLAQRRYAEAAHEAALLEIEDPLAPMACRTELFALLAGAQLDLLDAALARARTAGMDAAELDAFGAWRQAAAAGRIETPPGEGAVPLIALMLEALLRVQDFAPFEQLLGVLERAPIEERERRELLAEMYMRRGFAASAADEWMAVCRAEPDARALLGLARVAAFNGMAAEAGDFAQAALERDPGNALAAELLSRARDTVVQLTSG
jgi:tetratricopeptide (TPR) repeat protein